MTIKINFTDAQLRQLVRQLNPEKRKILERELALQDFLDASEGVDVDISEEEIQEIVNEVRKERGRQRARKSVQQ